MKLPVSSLHGALVILAVTLLLPSEARSFDLGNALRKLSVDNVVSNRAREASKIDIKNIITQSSASSMKEPLASANGDPTRAPQNAPSGLVSPESLALTLKGQSMAQREALLQEVERELAQLQDELAKRLNLPQRTPEISLEISALNDVISTKQVVREYLNGTFQSVTPAAAESFAALANPFFLICRDRLWAPKDPIRWIDKLSALRESLLANGRSVGLITLNDRPAGTAFVVGPRHLITNMHVVKSIADFDEKSRLWRVRPGSKVHFDVEYRLGANQKCDQPNQKRTYFVNAVFATPKTHSSDDIAVLLSQGDENFPRPLEVVEKPTDRYEGNMVVAVIGYPGPPVDMTVAEQIEFFQTPDKITPQFPYKRLSGGFTGAEKVTSDGYFVHRANTSGGNSGSPLLDLEDGRVVGIHVEGFNRFQDTLGYNRALTAVRVNHLLRDAGLK